VKPGDLVVKNRSHMDPSNLFYSAWLRPGIILGWLSTGGGTPTLWEVLYGDGEIEPALENELEVISESS
jgi:hypothetical protein